MAVAGLASLGPSALASSQRAENVGGVVVLPTSLDLRALELEIYVVEIVEGFPLDSPGEALELDGNLVVLGDHLADLESDPAVESRFDPFEPCCERGHLQRFARRRIPKGRVIVEQRDSAGDISRREAIEELPHALSVGLESRRLHDISLLEVLEGRQFGQGRVGLGQRRGRPLRGRPLRGRPLRGLPEWHDVSVRSYCGMHRHHRVSRHGRVKPARATPITAGLAPLSPPHSPCRPRSRPAWTGWYARPPPTCCATATPGAAPS